MNIKFKTFPWQTDIEFEDVETIEGTPRLYLTSDGKFPSMTSILSLLDDGGLDAWRARVGEEEAIRITSEASDRGNALHDYNELYLQNRLVRSDLKGQAKTLFNRVKPYLDQIEMMVATEAPLWSKTLQYAGRVDGIGMIDGKLMIIDHKNSRNPINLNADYNRKKLIKYCFQCAGYAKALYEMKGLKATHGCLIVGNHLTSTSDRFTFELEPFLPEVDILAGAYHRHRDISESAYHNTQKLTSLVETVKIT